MDVLERSYAYGRSPLPADHASRPLRACLFGSNISKSLSPKINDIIYEASQLPWKYALHTTTDSDEFRRVIQDPGVIGGSVTMPNKVAFMEVMDETTDDARAIGAVNTAFVRLDGQGRRRFIGANTDWVGVRDTMCGIPGIREKARGEPALVLGGGGAARSAIYALWTTLRPSEIYIVNRLKSEVEAMIRGFQRTVPGIKLRFVGNMDEARLLPAPVITVGTIPDMEPGTPDEMLAWEVCKTFLSRRGGGGAVVDMCYMPDPMTRLCRMGQDYGAAVRHGDEVLVRVCMGQITLWAERSLNQDLAGEVIKRIKAPTSKL